jgi:hypothetical protein
MSSMRTPGLFLNDLTTDLDETLRALRDGIMADLRVAIPGVVQSFNAQEMTVTVQPAIKERRLNPDYSQSWVTIPLLVDVPVVLPRAGGFMLTLPIQPGDECLVVFADAAIDLAWQNGGTDNVQPIRRRHNLSDGFAILGWWSQPSVPSSYSTTAAQLRTADGETYISLEPGEIDLVATTVRVNGTPIG